MQPAAPGSMNAPDDVVSGHSGIVPSMTATTVSTMTTEIPRIETKSASKPDQTLSLRRPNIPTRLPSPSSGDSKCSPPAAEVHSIEQVKWFEKTGLLTPDETADDEPEPRSPLKRRLTGTTIPASPTDTRAGKCQRQSRTTDLGFRIARPMAIPGQTCTTDHKIGSLNSVTISNRRVLEKCKRRSQLVGIRVGEQIYPPSVTDTDFAPAHTLKPTTLAAWREKELLCNFIQGPHHDPTDEPDPGFDTWAVRQFYIYYPPLPAQGAQGWKRRAGGLEFAPLSVLNARAGVLDLLLDGLVSTDGGSDWKYVSGLRLAVLSVDGYGDRDQTVVGPKSVFVQTKAGAARKRQVWLRLDGPAGPTYRPYQQAFLWVATLGKYLVDFVDSVVEDTGTITGVRLNLFQSRFSAWLEQRYGQDQQFRRWRSCYGVAYGSDFRVAIGRHADYLWKEACGVGISSDKSGVRVQSLPLWNDLLVLAGPIPVQPAVQTMTVVSKYVRDCFSTSYFSALLQVVESPDEVLQLRRQRETAAGFLALPSNAAEAPSTAMDASRHTPIQPTEIERGDVIAVSPDDSSGWRNTSGKEAGLEGPAWFAYVQKVLPNGKLSVLWLYRPSETIIGAAPYPVENELFLSDHCNCSESPLPVSDVLFQARTTVLIGPYKQTGSLTGQAWAEAVMADKARYFVRQSYQTVSHSFVTVRRSDLRCRCVYSGRATGPEYRTGDTVLVLVPDKPTDRLDPFVVVGPDADKPGSIRMRRLLRYAEVNPQAERVLPNQVVWTDEMTTVPASAIVRACHVRFFGPDEDVPPPYRLGGSGDCWVLTHSKVTVAHDDRADGTDDGADARPLPFAVVRLDSAPGPVELTQGFDSTVPPPDGFLPALSLFSGGGGLDRGLEAAHAVRTRWAVEWDRSALHTLRANAGEDADSIGYWLGSIDDFVAAGLKGEPVGRVGREGGPLVPRPGLVRLLSSGSPCQGFSIMQKFQMSEASRRNSSRVASTVTALWLYLPDYFLIENVPNMARMLGPNNIFSQLVSSAVGLGYQVWPMHVDGWATGAPQSRTRLFLSCAAPGLTPAGPPASTHSHPPWIRSAALGTVAASGVNLAPRKFGPTPFQFVSASEAVADLPSIRTGHLPICLANPDHVLPFPQPPLQRARIAQLPILPVEMGLREVYDADPAGMTEPVRLDIQARRTLISKSSGNVIDNSWRRINPDKLFPTVTTTCQPKDRFSGPALHWHEGRTLTIAEVRRAQGWHDTEPLLGTLSTQWKILGNGVPRHLGAAWGVRLREAVEADCVRRRQDKQDAQSTMPPWK